MSSDTPSTKRKRTNSTSAEPTRSKFWFDDGNIVLQADSTLFKVHRSMLARHSGVFENMFSMPQPADSEEPTVDDCPVVFLSDHAEDVGNVMSIFYDNKVHSFKQALHISVVTSMLRLGRKYDIDYLANDAMQRLQHDWPNTLRDWDEGSYGKEGTAIIMPGPPNNQDFLVEALLLACEFRLQSILPVIFAEYSMFTTLEGILKETKISWEAKERCIKGRDRIMEYSRAAFANCIPPTAILSRDCCTIELCEANATAFIKQVSLLNLEDGNIGLLSEWDRSPEQLGYIPAMCPECATALVVHFKLIRAVFWQELPSFFELPGWADLKDFVD